METRELSADGANLLVLLLGDDDAAEAAVQAAVDARSEPPARIHVVAPASVRPLDWLATADDAAHRRAEARVLASEWRLAEDAIVDGEAADVDPVQAVEDALRAFDADEILLAGPADEDLERGLGRFGLPVMRVDTAERRRRSRGYRALRTLAAGRDPAVPFVLFFGVNAVLLLAGILLSAAILVLLWLIGAL